MNVHQRARRTSAVFDPQMLRNFIGAVDAGVDRSSLELRRPNYMLSRRAACQPTLVRGGERHLDINGLLNMRAWIFHWMSSARSPVVFSSKAPGCIARGY